MNRRDHVFKPQLILMKCITHNNISFYLLIITNCYNNKLLTRLTNFFRLGRRGSGLAMKISGLSYLYRLQYWYNTQIY